MKPGSPAWEKRVAELLAAEYREPFVWWWLTFSSGDTFVGAAIVRAQGFNTAVLRCHALGIHPGSEAEGCPLAAFGGKGEPKPQEVNRLFSPAELEALITLAEAAAAAVN